MNSHLTVILPVHNGGQYIKEAIDSILNQTFRNFRLLVINDGSTDHTASILSDYSDDRLKVVTHAHSLGLVSTLNQALAMCNTPLIARMDADDIALPTRFEKQVEYLAANRHIDMVATRVVLINEKGDETGHWPEDHQAHNERSIRQLLPRANCIAHPTVMFRQEALRDLRYDPALLHSEDWGLWLDMLCRGRVIGKINEALLKYRVHSAGITVQTNSKGAEKKVRSFHRIYLRTRLLKFGPVSVVRDVAIAMARKEVKQLLAPVLLTPYQLLVHNPLKLFRQYSELCRQLDKKPSLVFIFPYFHTGGAEQVHFDIVSALSGKDILIVFTRTSADQKFLNSFRSKSPIVVINHLTKVDYYRRRIFNRFRKWSYEISKPVLFGSNARLLYDLLPYVSDKTRAMDLVHAFVGFTESGPERWSLPVASRLDARVVINRRTLDDFRVLYRAHGLDERLLERIMVIQNGVEVPAERPDKKDASSFVVMYSGRGSSEKRLHLLEAIAKKLSGVGQVRFLVAGEVRDFIGDTQGLELLGNISNEAELKAYYRTAHLIIITSSREGFPLSLMEGMAAGAVPLSTNVGGIPEHILHNQTGLLVTALEENKIVDEMAEQILRLSSERIEWDRLSSAAHDYALKHFSKNDFINSYRKLLS